MKFDMKHIYLIAIKKKFFILAILMMTSLGILISHFQRTNFSVKFFRGYMIGYDIVNIRIEVLKIEARQGNIVSSTSTDLSTDEIINSQLESICQHKEFMEIAKPCIGKMAWEDRPSEKTSISNTANSTVKVTVRPYPYPSIVEIRTKDMRDKWKYYGGDYWDVKIINKQVKLMIDVQMIDLNDGTYTGYFILPSDGDKELKYQLICTLESSQCNGIRDPPPYWFKSGSIQGKFQRDGLLGDHNDFLHQPFQTKIFFKTNTIIKTVNHDDLVDRDVNKPMNVLNRYCGYWKNNEFVTFHHSRQHLYQKKEIVSKSPTKPFETLMIFGDSMAKYFHESIHQNHTLCSKWFKKCSLSYIWVYKLVNPERDRHDGVHKHNNKDFDQERFVKTIKTDLMSISHRKSAFVFNFGCHTVMTLPFKKLQMLLNNVLQMITALKRKLGEENFSMVIWKSTTPSTLENFHPLPTTQLRFLTKQRIHAWNAYSLSLCRRYKIPILDVYTIASSYPDGPYDLVHYMNSVFRSAEDDLEDFLLKSFGII